MEEGRQNQTAIQMTTGRKLDKANSGAQEFIWPAINSNQ